MATSMVREQVDPGAATNTTLYTVPSGKKATVRVWFCNRSGTASAIRIAIRKDGGGISDEMYLRYDKSLGGNSDGITAPITLAATDILMVRTENATVAFNANGIEQDV